MTTTYETHASSESTVHRSSRRLYEPDTAMASVISSPQRCNLWGDARYRGNCDGTLFKELVHRYKPLSVADPMVGSGTTRDVVRGMADHGYYNGRYWSGDLHEGFDLTSQPLPGRFDMVWVHPPYWNIIRYSDHPADISTIHEYDRFIESLAGCLRRCSEALNRGGTLAVLLGDVRRQGRYYCLSHQVMSQSDRLGELASVIIKTQHNCTSDRRHYRPMPHVPIRHEYCLVFQRK